MNDDIRPRDTELTEQELDQVAGGYRYELKNATVSSYNVAGSGHDDRVRSESLSLDYEEIRFTD